MRRVLVFTPDLLFYSQVKGVAERGGWTALRLGQGMPEGGVDGDVVVVDATRDLDRAYGMLEAAKKACPWLVLACHQHKEVQVGEECIRRGATEAVRRGLILERLAARLSGPGPA